MIIKFSVPGRPVPMARPRVTIHGTYTPKRCRDFKDSVMWVARQAMKGKEPLDGALVCRIDLFFPIPKSYTCGKRHAAQHNIQKPTGRNSGDADNHAKAVLDALKGICWNDDSQVTRLTVRKRFTETGERVEVIIGEDEEQT